MPAFTALFDACVLYPAPLRDLLMTLATTGLFRARWTDRIHDEWIRNVLANRPDLTPEQLARTRALMDEQVADSLVVDYEDLIGSLALPDEDDRHVLAAAIRGKADVIVTFNLRDFPQDVLGRYDIEPQHPDVFIEHLLGIDEARVISAAMRQRARLRNPPLSAERFLDTLERQSLALTVAWLRKFIEVI